MMSRHQPGSNLTRSPSTRAPDLRKIPRVSGSPRNSIPTSSRIRSAFRSTISIESSSMRFTTAVRRMTYGACAAGRAALSAMRRPRPARRGVFRLLPVTGKAPCAACAFQTPNSVHPAAKSADRCLSCCKPLCQFTLWFELPQRIAGGRREWNCRLASIDGRNSSAALRSTGSRISTMMQ